VRIFKGRKAVNFLFLKDLIGSIKRAGAESHGTEEKT